MLTEQRNIFIFLLATIINGGYLFIGLISLITFVFRTYKTFFFISELLMALIYLVLGSAIIYFGKKISKIIQRSNFGILFFSFGGISVLKGIGGLFGGLGINFPLNHNVYDFFWFLILEAFPTIIFICISKNEKNKNK